jgi:1-acyl-sn-glycerol-3-phosphate acyltransferase
MAAPPPQQPDLTHRAADRQLVPLAVAAAAGFCAAVWADERVVGRTPLYFGAGLAGLVGVRLVHRYRCLGLVPPGATIAALMALVGAVWGDWPGWAVAAVPLALGLAAGAVLRYRDRVRTEHRRFVLCGALAGVAGIVTAAVFTRGQGADDWRAAYSWLTVGASAVAAALAWPTLFRPFVEYLVCFGMRFIYKPRAAGPGLTAFPRHGPVLVIANHGDWFDPPLVGGLLPRTVTPLMAAAFYDKPGLRWLMRVFGVIRVPDQPVRRETPELDEAVRALDLGKVVLLFPEGYLRRKEEVPLRRFGQGVWKLLDARPTTPVVPCWVEGTWGSYFSFKGGPPTKGKRFRPRRPVAVGFGEPLVVPPEVLKDRTATRLFLMRRVSDARRHAGLDPLPADQLPLPADDRGDT